MSKELSDGLRRIADDIGDSANRPQFELLLRSAAEIERLTEENERLMRCISGIEDELCREPPRVGDALFVCEAAKATETKMPPDQQSESKE